MPERHFTFAPKYLGEAYREATEGGQGLRIPIGAALVYDDGDRVEVFRGHNQRIQGPSNVLHAEMDCLENAGSHPAAWYRHTTLFTTLFPCPMCSGAVALFGIPRVVIGEAQNFPDAEGLKKGRAFFELHGVEYQILNDERCIQALAQFIREHPSHWHEDVPYQDGA